LFVRQVVAELKKVVRPTRNELLTYFTVVLVFVVAVMTYVSLLDFGFGKLVLWVFGGGS
jgi:preprotein translocase subunit SecE